MNAVGPEAMETQPQTRPRQPESEPGCEPGERNVRPRVESESNECRMDGDEERQPSSHRVRCFARGCWSRHAPRKAEQRERFVRCTNDQSFSVYLTVLPCQTGFDCKAQAMVHGSVDALPEQDTTTFEASKCMVVFDNEPRSYWVAPKPKDKSGVEYNELSSENKKKFDASRFEEIDNLLKLNGLSVMTVKDSDNFAKLTP